MALQDRNESNPPNFQPIFGNLFCESIRIIVYGPYEVIRLNDVVMRTGYSSLDRRTIDPQIDKELKEMLDMPSTSTQQQDTGGTFWITN